ncbi:MAG: 3-carboxyethylcatechol 2,3-dioxygenase [Ottowia sp.]|uniref:3-carboxyethylcatechol 2,3-dioxygenase n=1 Tax=Ottowia sp. TaxID=1898956 RepID=UPI0039E323E2
MSSQPRRAFLGMSHTPLYGLNPLEPQVEADLRQGIARAREEVLKFAPELIVLVGPDHYNGFFNALMPPLCIGSQATAVGDYLTPSGALNVDEAAALGLAEWLMEHDFDLALSRRMEVDHGFSQVLQFIWGDGMKTPPLVPIFMNAVAQPGIPRLRRCLQLGREMGRFLDTLPQRTLLIGSGGLSHEPPVPTLAHPDPAVRERITLRHKPTQADRDAKTERVKAAGMALARGDSDMKPLNPAWDQHWMEALASGRLDALAQEREDLIEQEAGLSAHESKTWLIARGALPSDRALPCPLRHYQAIPVLIAGYGILFLHDA